MRERALEIPLGRIAALCNDGRGPRVLALHGWLDNAASFLPMAPFLDGLELVAIDLPGHGRSAHLPPGADYSFAGTIASVLDVADALGWERFALLGHSMGAGIASLAAAACPQRIDKLVAIEALGALADEAGHTVQRMREAVADAALRVERDADLFKFDQQFAHGGHRCVHALRDIMTRASGNAGRAGVRPARNRRTACGLRRRAFRCLTSSSTCC